MKEKQKTRSVEIISIGDELLNSGRLNTTAPHMSKILTGLGFHCSIHTLSDDVEKLTNFLKSSLADIIITCGGLGPTQDDNTLLAISRAFKQPLVYHGKHLAFLKKIQLKRNLSERFLKQALYPEKFSLEKSDWGTAPFLYCLNPKNFRCELIVLLPGVPLENINLFEKKTLPLLKKHFVNDALFIKNLKILGIPESIVEKRIETLVFPTDEISLAFLPSAGELLVQLKGKNDKNLLNLRRRIKKLFPDQVVYFSDQPVSYVLHRYFIKQKMRLGFVESLTGGLFTQEFIQYPDSSKYLDSSLVTYSNEAKNELGGVGRVILEKHGAVSPETAMNLAKNHLLKRNLDLALALTGVAGPSAVQENVLKKVGLVYLAIAHKNASAEVTLEYRKLSLTGNRDQIREKTIKRALIFLAERFLKSSSNQ